MQARSTRLSCAAAVDVRAALATAWAAALVARQERLIFGRPWRIRPVPLGPHADRYNVVDAPHDCGDGARLEGWRAEPVGAAPRRVLIYFGGRNENAAWAPHMASWLGPDWVVRVCNHRGFAGSTGEPSEAHAMADGLAIARAESDPAGLTPQDLVIGGRSLGAAIATQVAAQLPGAGVLLLTPPKSVAAIVERHRLLAPLLPQLRNRFDAIDHAPRVTGRSLVVLAANDRMVPQADSRALAAALGGPVTLEVIPGTNHLSLPRHPLTQALLASWASRLDSGCC